MTGQQKHNSVIDSVAEWGQQSQYSKEERVTTPVTLQVDEMLGTEHFLKITI